MIATGRSIVECEQEQERKERWEVQHKRKRFHEAIPDYPIRQMTVYKFLKAAGHYSLGYRTFNRDVKKLIDEGKLGARYTNFNGYGRVIWRL